jgi:hypothetical protein
MESGNGCRQVTGQDHCDARFAHALLADDERVISDDGKQLKYSE